MSAPITLDWPSIIAASRESHAQWLAEAAATEAAAVAIPVHAPAHPLLIYVATPYAALWKFAPHKRQKLGRTLGYLGVCIWRMHAVAVIPALNSWSFHTEIENHELFYTGYIELLLRCDALFAAFRHIESHGRTNEMHVAEQAGIPCFTKITQLQQWLASQKGVTR